MLCLKLSSTKAECLHPLSCHYLSAIINQRPIRVSRVGMLVSFGQQCNERHSKQQLALPTSLVVLLTKSVQQLPSSTLQFFFLCVKSAGNTLQKLAASTLFISGNEAPLMTRFKSSIWANYYIKSFSNVCLCEKSNPEEIHLLFSENPAIDAALSHSVLALQCIRVWQSAFYRILCIAMTCQKVCQSLDLLAESLSTCAPFKHLDLLQPESFFLMRLV